MKSLLFGTAGIPMSTRGDTLQGIKDIKKLNLDLMELEFVQSINISKEKAPEVKKVAEEENIILTCHAPYYINLNAKEKEKIGASRTRIFNSAKIADMCGAYSMCFHPGFYMKQEPERVYDKIKEELKKVHKELKDNGIKIWIRPETTGKASQFGSLDECIKLSKDIPQILPCIDFAHLHARDGKNNTEKEFHEILTKVEKHLGKTALQNMHIHLSGINYGDKGEKNHLILKDSDMNYKDLLKSLKEFHCKGVVVCESPNIEKDAMLLKKTYSTI
jgi:deoxyribonuclease-4